MVTLVINPGSSSKKYAFYKEDELLLKIRFEKTEEGFGRSVQVGGEQMRREDVSVHIYREALHEVLSLARTHKVIGSLADITTVAVRVVAPGTFFQHHQPIDESYISKLIRVERSLPLHIPPILEEIANVIKLLKHSKLVGVSDSAFHRTIPEVHYRYSVRDAESLEVRRYGYHGLSVAAAVRTLPSLVENAGKRIVVAHIGSGASVTALQSGSSIYNSMGFTPASGMLMGSRAGDMDPGAVVEVLNRTGTKLSGGHRYLQTNGGFAGLLGTSDIRTVLMREQHGDVRAAEAMKMFCFDVQCAIMTAVIALGGLDTLVLTATAMERNTGLRARVLKGLSFYGIALDEATNDKVPISGGVISSQDSSACVAVVPTDEMGEMARIAHEHAND